MQVFFMISCKNATELTEKNLAGELGRADRIRLLLHRMMCAACRRYSRQSQTLDQLLRRKAKRPTVAKDATPAKVLEGKILDKLKDL